jgi:hypothetical protein
MLADNRILYWHPHWVVRTHFYSITDTHKAGEMRQQETDTAPRTYVAQHFYWLLGSNRLNAGSVFATTIKAERRCLFDRWS